SHLGGLIGLVETILPDNISALFNGATDAIISENVSNSGITLTSSLTGKYVFNISSLGLSNIPKITASCENDATNSYGPRTGIYNVTTASFEVWCTGDNLA